MEMPGDPNRRHMDAHHRQAIDDAWQGHHKMKMQALGYWEKVYLATDNPRDAQHPWRTTSSRPAFKAKCWQFGDDGDGKASEIAVDSLTHLHDLLGPPDTIDAAAAAPCSPCSRRLIILEGINPRVAELMGVKLDIPPGFWLAHCDYCDSLTTADSARSSSSLYWKLDIPLYRQDPTAWDNVPCADVYIRTHRSMTQSISYRAIKHTKDSWTAILLLDAGKVHLKPDSSEQTGLATTPLDKFQDKTSTSSISVSRCQDQEEYDDAQTPISLYEELNSLVKKLPLYTTGDPFSVTTYIRNMVCREWEFYESAYAQYLYDSLSADSVEYRRIILGGAAAELNDGSHVAILTRYQILVERKHEIAYAINSVRQAMWTFCRRDKEYHRRQFQREHLRRKAGRRGGGGACTGADNHGAIDSDNDFDELLESQMEAIDMEAHRWAELRENLEDLQTGACAWMNIYAQRASLEEALAANRQARSAGQLTKIATVAVPFGMVAAIFSMGGSFAAGGRDFYLFWVISLPISLGLLGWVLYEDIVKWFWDTGICDSKKKTLCQ